jgi:hypothetical protein
MVRICRGDRVFARELGPPGAGASCSR